MLYQGWRTVLEMCQVCSECRVSSFYSLLDSSFKINLRRGGNSSTSTVPSSRRDRHRSTWPHHMSTGTCSDVPCVLQLPRLWRKGWLSAPRAVSPSLPFLEVAVPAGCWMGLYETERSNASCWMQASCVQACGVDWKG